MNSQKEQVFVEKYINKRYKERLQFELSSKKKRRDGLDRFSHDTESAIDSKKLTLKTNKLNKPFFIKLFRNANNVYVLSDKYLDGKEMSILMPTNTQSTNIAQLSFAVTVVQSSSRKAKILPNTSF